MIAEPRRSVENANGATVDVTAFRHALSRLAAGVSVITTSLGDHNVGLTATAVTSLSLNPPLILACIGAWSQAIAPMRAGRPFLLHLLRHDQQHLARQFATTQADKFAGVPWSATPSGCPRLHGVLSSVECVPQQLYPGGDHLIVVGRVVSIQLGDEEGRPLIYFRRQFCGLEPGEGATPSGPAS